MAKCAKCGNDLPVDAVFCPQCAQRVVIQAPAPMPPVGVATISDVLTIPGVGVARPTNALAEGEVFHGRYVIERQLGAGAMGVVYAAKDQVTGRTVALKLINPALADRPTARERFLREGLMARDVRHANIVAMYDVGEANNQIYLVMEFLSGETLRKWLRRTLQEGRDVSFDTAREIIRRILEGLAAAHATGVVHRDLKPENVMLAGDPNTGNYSLKILDFGIARAVGAGSHVTTTSSSTGTPLYMAPEQKTAADTVGPPADLYAVTAMLYELLLGVAPEGRWSAPSRERSDLPPGIDAVIETGLASRPRSRYQTADEYIRALDRIAVIAPPPPLPPPEPPTPPKPPEPVHEEKRVSSWDWLKSHSPGWILWNRLSRPQRIVLMVLTVVVTLAIIWHYNSPPPEGPSEPKPPVTSPTSPGTESTPPTEPQAPVAKAVPPPTEPQAPVAKAAPPPVAKAVPPKTKPVNPPQPPPVTEPVNPPQPPPVTDMVIAGRWFISMTGSIVALGYVDIFQQGNVVSGRIYNTYGVQVGALSGRVRGTTLQYDYLAATGMTGRVTGRLTEDTMHLELDLVNPQTGYRERQTLHRNHLPHQ